MKEGSRIGHSVQTPPRMRTCAQASPRAKGREGKGRKAHTRRRARTCSQGSPSQGGGGCLFGGEAGGAIRVYGAEMLHPRS